MNNQEICLLIRKGFFFRTSNNFIFEKYLEESLAALAGSDSIVLAGGIVATHGTKHALALWCLMTTARRRSC